LSSLRFLQAVTAGIGGIVFRIFGRRSRPRLAAGDAGAEFCR